MARMSRLLRSIRARGAVLGRWEWIAGLAGVAVAAGVSGCAAPEPPPPAKPRNVVVILLDTLRADHLGAYGYHRPTSPYFDELASRGVLFEHATSAAPATFPSVNSLFTSRLPDLFFDTSSEDLGIPEELTTMAEAYGAAGYQTAAVSASPVVRASPSFFNPAGGFGQGFESFDESCGYSERHVPSYTAPCVTDQAVATLDGLGEGPFFFYIHYLDPHDPYQPPEDGVIFHTPGEYQKIPSVAEGRTYPITRSILGRSEEPIEVRPEDIQHLVDLYDGEIRAVDSELERLMTAFEERGLAEDTLFVFVSDHGESFLEHENVLQHGRSVYQSELHVVLMFYWPKGLEPTRRREPVCSVDVMPTLMELSGLEIPEGSQGVALLGLDDRPRRGRGSCVAAGRPDWRARQADLLALRMGSDKVIYRRSADRWEMYDLNEDADELRDLLAGDTPPERFATLRQTADAWIQAIAAADSDEGPIELDPEVEKALRALGYIQ